MLMVWIFFSESLCFVKLEVWSRYRIQTCCHWLKCN